MALADAQAALQLLPLFFPHSQFGAQGAVAVKNQIDNDKTQINVKAPKERFTIVENKVVDHFQQNEWCAQHQRHNECGNGDLGEKTVFLDELFFPFRQHGGSSGCVVD